MLDENSSKRIFFYLSSASSNFYSEHTKTMKTGLIFEAHTLFRIHFRNAVWKQEYVNSVEKQKHSIHWCLVWTSCQMPVEKMNKKQSLH